MGRALFSQAYSTVFLPPSSLRNSTTATEIDAELTNPPGQQQQLQHGQQQHPPLGQLGPTPSPHLSQMNRGGGMLPPNRPQGMNPMNPQQQGQGGPGGAPPPSSQYQQVGRPPSRTATPGQQAGMMHQSLSLGGPRQPPGRAPPGTLMPGGGRNEHNINEELLHIPPAQLSQLKQEAGFGDKDLPSLVMGEKQQIIDLYRLRMGLTDNAAAGPSNQMMQPLNRNAQQQQQQQYYMHTQQQQQQQPQGGPQPMMSMSPILGVPPMNSSMGGPTLGTELFATDFIQSVASSLDDFDPGMFRPDGDINFEREFGQWFNHPDEVSAWR